MMRFILLGLLALMTTTAWCEVKAVINAPEQVNAGDLVILDSSQSVGANRIWVTDKSIDGRWVSIEDGKRVFFAIGTPGVYTFQLIVADTDASIAQVKHNVRVGNSIPVPPVPPPVEPPPTSPPTNPAPPVVDRAVFKAVRASTQYINDPATAAAIREAILSLPEKVPSTVQNAIANVLLNRKDQSKDWFNYWRVPVNKAIDAAQIPYPEVVKQIVEGLETTAMQTDSVVKLYVRANCPPCDQWKLQVLPIVLSYGWAVIEEPTSTRATPSFEITTNGKTSAHEGYLSFDDFSSIVAKMRK
jgi:hypothetical protein